MALKDAAFRALTLTTTISVYTLIVLGGAVSSTGSGLACHDWPLCNGQILPKLTASVLLEFIHRLWTILVTVLVITTAGMAWTKYHWQNKITFFSTLTFILLLIQIILGMFTVTSENLDVVVTSHLALASLVFGSTVVVAILSQTIRREGE